MKSIQNISLALTFVGSTLSLNPAFAQATMDHSQMGTMPMTMHAASPTDTAMSTGEVKKINIKAQTITLKHGPIANLGMPAMTMTFKAKTPALLDKAKAGDKVKFSAEMPNDVLTLTAIELAK